MGLYEKRGSRWVKTMGGGGTGTSDGCVIYTDTQDLTYGEKITARRNIGAMAQKVVVDVEPDNETGGYIISYEGGGQELFDLYREGAEIVCEYHDTEYEAVTIGARLDGVLGIFRHIDLTNMTYNVISFLMGFEAQYCYAEAASVEPILKTETWTFTLEDGSTVEKAVYVG